jgi:hypothetical protein
MARQYALASKLPGLSGSIQTLQNGEIVQPGAPLEPGQTFDVQYFFTARFPDANGIIYSSRFMVEIQDISTGVSNAGLVSALQSERANVREMAKNTIGSPITTL